ncbi:MAG: NAD-dependent epimerase/dehydratase family protein [Thalassobaculum sp.]|jgi:nucleoside-diphosphate-sugar epimerase
MSGADAHPTVVVCGATGFIGRNCVERFAALPGYSVRGVFHRRPPYEHPGVDWIRADLTRAEDAARAIEGADIVIQAAATTSGAGDIFARPHIHITDTAIIQSQVLRAAFDQGVRHLVTFSCSIMYESRDEPHDEESFDANAPITQRYFGGAWNKIYFEKMGEFFASLGRMQVSVIRHTNVYGPHDKFDLDRSHVFGATVTKVLTATDRVIVWGDGSEARDLIYVDDLVDLVRSMIERQSASFDLVCAGSGEAVRISDLVRRIIDAAGRPLKIEFDTTKPTIPTSISLGYEKAATMYSWSPKIELDEGILRTIKWWRENRPAG